MNILHMKYAVEVARLGSLNKASEALLIAQPNISRSIKELEADLGILIFCRSTKGMTLTPEGEKFIGYAKGILKHIDDVAFLYKGGAQKKQALSVCVPRDGAASQAFATFCTSVEADTALLRYKECDAGEAIQNVLNHECTLAVVRYEKKQEGAFLQALAEKQLCYESIVTFSPRLLMSGEHPLAWVPRIEEAALDAFVEISCGDLYLPKTSRNARTDAGVAVIDRAAALELLCTDKQAFMWAASPPSQVLARYDLVARECADNARVWCDTLVWRDGYKLSKQDKLFLEILLDVIAEQGEMSKQIYKTDKKAKEIKEWHKNLI